MRNYNGYHSPSKYEAWLYTEPDSARENIQDMGNVSLKL